MMLAKGTNKNDCVKFCKAVTSLVVTGCEYHRDGDCTIHTESVSNGNRYHRDSSHYNCWAFRNHSNN